MNTLTKQQRDALNLSLMYLGMIEEDMAKETSSQLIYTRFNKMYYTNIVSAMQTIEEMLRGVQGELPMDYHGEGTA